MKFFVQMGYVEKEEVYGMDILLYDFALPQDVNTAEKQLAYLNINFRPYSKSDTLMLMLFMKTSFPGGWVRNVRECLLKERGEKDILICRHISDRLA